jgi:hypothetical protein
LETEPARVTVAKLLTAVATALGVVSVVVPWLTGRVPVRSQTVAVLAVGIGLGVLGVSLATEVMGLSDSSVRHNRTAVAASLIGLLIVAVGIVGAVVPNNESATALQGGAYVQANSRPSSPHYFVVLSHDSNGTVAGSVAFLYQDGQTEPEFTFTASLQAGIATLKTSNSTVVTASYDKGGFTLGECPGYLKRVGSMADCTFKYSPNGVYG